MSDTGMIVSVQLQAGKHSADWNLELRDPLGRPIGQLPERALDDAVFSINGLKDMRELDRLREFRVMRHQMIMGHFANCARQLIDKIEIEEGWDDWLSKVNKQEQI